MLGDVANGINSFKKGMTEEDEARPADRRVEALDQPRTVTVEKDKAEERQPL
jgi:Sec-independent protein translocase protein TatA